MAARFPEEDESQRESSGNFDFRSDTEDEDGKLLLFSNFDFIFLLTAVSLIQTLAGG